MRAGPCPVCRMPDGFHERLWHRAVVVPYDLLKPPGWTHMSDAEIAAWLRPTRREVTRDG